MANSFFLVSGVALDPSDQLDWTHAPTAQASLVRLTQYFHLLARATLINEEHYGFAHYEWLWRALQTKADPPAVAAAQWRHLGLPSLNQNMWTLTFWQVDEADQAHPALLSDETKRHLQKSITRALNGQRIKLQRPDDDHWFITFAQGLRCEATPHYALPHLPASEWSLHGLDAQAWLDLQSKLSSIASFYLQKPTVAWLSGGGNDQNFTKPSRIKYLYSNDPIANGWGQLANLPATQNRPIDELARHLQQGPRTPRLGDAIYYWDSLMAPFLNKQWAAWDEQLGLLVNTLCSYLPYETDRADHETYLVLCGQTSVATFRFQKPSFFSRLTAKSSSSIKEWLLQ